MEIFNGNKFAREILEGLKQESKTLAVKPGVAVVGFGEESAFIKRKRETAEFLGFNFRYHSFDESIGAKEFRERLNEIVRSHGVTAVVVQLPLPRNIKPAALNAIPIEKDPDFLSDRAVGLFFNDRSIVSPPSAQAIIGILERDGTKLENSKVAVFGYGNLVGRFLVKMLLDAKAQVRIAAHPMSQEDISEFVSGSDIVISAVGSHRFLDAALLPEGAAVVDAGFSMLDGKIAGDINFEAVPDKFKLIVPVPGGVGPVGVAMLFKNIIELCLNTFPRRD